MALPVLHRPREGQGLHGVHGAGELRGRDDQGGWAAPQAWPRRGVGLGAGRATWWKSSRTVCRALTTVEVLDSRLCVTSGDLQRRQPGGGVPVYRGKHGVWARRAPASQLGQGLNPRSPHPRLLPLWPAPDSDNSASSGRSVG